MRQHVAARHVEFIGHDHARWINGQ
jgi:hypothetical protein